MYYKILVIRSVLGNHCFELLSGNSEKVAHSNMFTRQENCLKAAKKLAKKLDCKIDFKNLEMDYE